jgi:predicted dinucleotide-binding enzyme
VKIGIIGAGRMGGTLAVLLAQAGHQVLPSNARGPDSLRDLAAKAGPNAHPSTPEEAARDSELVIVALPWGHPEALPAPDVVAGKIVVDAMNAYGGGATAADKANSTEQVARALPGAHVVKAFNTLNFATVRKAAGRTGKNRLSMFVAGDDAAAKRVVAGLMHDIGFAAIDTGNLHNGARLQQPGSPIYNRQVTEAQAREMLKQGT